MNLANDDTAKLAGTSMAMLHGMAIQQWIDMGGFTFPEAYTVALLVKAKQIYSPVNLQLPPDELVRFILLTQDQTRRYYDTLIFCNNQGRWLADYEYQEFMNELLDSPEDQISFIRIKPQFAEMRDRAKALNLTEELDQALADQAWIQQDSVIETRV